MQSCLVLLPFAFLVFWDTNIIFKFSGTHIHLQAIKTHSQHFVVTQVHYLYTYSYNAYLPIIIMIFLCKDAWMPASQLSKQKSSTQNIEPTKQTCIHWIHINIIAAADACLAAFKLHSNKLIIQWYFHTTPKYSLVLAFVLIFNWCWPSWCTGMDAVVCCSEMWVRVFH